MPPAADTTVMEHTVGVRYLLVDTEALPPVPLPPPPLLSLAQFGFTGRGFPLFRLRLALGAHGGLNSSTFVA